MTPIEQELCNKIRLGDKEAFDVLFNTYYSSLCNYAFDILKREEAAKDVVLDLFLKIWMSKDTFIINTSVKGYLFRAIHNQCISYIRAANSAKTIDFISIDDNKNILQVINIETPPEIIEKLFMEEMEADLRKVLDALPEQCREIFYLCRFENLTYPEIASKLNLALSTVKTQMLRAIARLKDEFEK